MLSAIVLAIVQGLTEFWPISSSAHLTLLPWAMGWKDPGNSFDAALHLGTLVVLLAYFRVDLVRLARAFVASVISGGIGEGTDASDRRLAWLVVIASIPGGLIGLLLKRHAETTFRSPMLIGAALAGMGLLLWLADRFGARRRGLTDLRVVDALLVGLSQACAIIPGVSRSGSTMTAGRALSLDREAAARFSFLLAAPITTAAALIKLKDLAAEGGVDAAFLVATVTAGVTGWAAIAVLLRMLRTRSFLPFVVYRVALGIAVMALAHARG